MTNIAIVTDSNSGITQKQASELGIHVLPMPFMMNEETFFEDIDFSQDEFYQRLENGVDIGTSQPSPESLLSLWDNLLKTHSSVLHIPMSKGLSGSCESAQVLSRDYDGKVLVVDNQRISVTQMQSVFDAIELRNKDLTVSEIKTRLEEDKFNSSIYIMLDTLYYLKKGGRITPAAAALGTILKLKPVLTIQGDKLDAFAKARTTTQGKSIMMNAIKNDIVNRFGGITPEKDIWLYIVHSCNPEAAEVLKNELLEMLPGYPVHIDNLSLSVACHIGPGSLAIACCKKMKY